MIGHHRIKWDFSEADNKRGAQTVIEDDAPVGRSGDDPRLARVSTADSWLREISDASAEKGLVFAIYGPWGTGKTSILNMIEENLRSQEKMVVNFNPWLFSGTDQLVEFFFSEVAEQLEVGDSKSQAVAKSLKKYGALFSPLKAIPVVGTAAGGLAESALAIGKFMEDSQKKDIRAKRDQLRSALAELPSPLVVLVDDIDRLTGQEIRDMLRMVRLTGSFPNVIYVLAFDRKRVEHALSDDGFPGRAYLEKIVQVNYDVPRISRSTLQSIFVDALNEVLSGLAESRVSADLFPDVMAEIIEPLLKTVRDIKRFKSSLGATLRLVGNNVEAIDVIALEAVRIFLPDAFEKLADAINGLTTIASSPNTGEEGLKGEVQAFLDAEPEYVEVLRAICARIFPASSRHVGGNLYHAGNQQSRWMRDRRAAAGPVLRYYLERVLPGEISTARSAETLFSQMNDLASFEATLNDLEATEAESAIVELEAYENEFAGLDPSVPVLAILNQSKRLERERQGMFDFGPDMALTRVVYRLLRDRPQDMVLSIVENIIPRLTTLSSVNRLLLTVGHTENAGHEMISVADDQRLTENLSERIRAATGTTLGEEPDLIRLLLTAKAGESWELPNELVDNPSFCSALISQLTQQRRSQAWGTRTVRTHGHFEGDLAVRILGSLDQLDKALTVAQGSLTGEQVELVMEYLSRARSAADSDSRANNEE